MDQLELRRQRRMAMRGAPERLGLRFAQGNIEMRAKPNGTAAGSNFEWRGYATVYDHEFDMWDQNGDPFTEHVAQGAARRSLANPNLDVPFLVGHNDAGIPLARTKSGTMSLAEDTQGVFTHVPAMDGRREEVRALASAVERGDLDEMSLAFVCLRQAWDDAYERRTVLEMDLHRGDVCAVTHGANPATAGASMLPVEQLAFRRPAAIGGPHLLEHRAASLAVAHGHPGKPCVDPDGDGDCDATPQGDTDHDYWTADGKQIKPLPGEDRSDGRPYELRAQMSTADINDLPDSAFAFIESGGEKDSEDKTTPRSKRHFPIVDAAHVRNALARIAQGAEFGEQALPAVKAAAKKFGITVSDEHAAALFHYELRASAAEDMTLAASSDYNAEPMPALTCPKCKEGSPVVPFCAQCGHNFATGATVAVDGSTGIPGEEVQMADGRKLELMMRELELEELARQ